MKHNLFDNLVLETYGGILGTSQLLKVSRILNDVFNQYDIDYYITGGLALAYHNYHRTTTDIDIVVNNIEYVKRVLAGNGFKNVQGNPMKMLHKETGVEIDILPANGKVGPVEINFYDPKDVDGNVLGIEQLISLKLDCYKHNGMKRVKDLGDVSEIIQRNNLPRELKIDPSVQEEYYKLWDDINK